jgi:hypothetical protein
MQTGLHNSFGVKEALQSTKENKGPKLLFS